VGSIAIGKPWIAGALGVVTACAIGLGFDFVPAFTIELAKTTRYGIPPFYNVARLFCADCIVWLVLAGWFTVPSSILAYRLPAIGTVVARWPIYLVILAHLLLGLLLGFALYIGGFSFPGI
jgi:hypothetical protein